ncbi:unnamed protein product [Moneuplotes crassus]|uniref:SWIM-type domain-containing protein n=1 Tax=Euplotes crassus TaxID=5936 RepID=A0AAD1Y5H9_EUPCR|nr:unnamed protein product [Moneuplotes crassus]
MSHRHLRDISNIYTTSKISERELLEKKLNTSNSDKEIQIKKRTKKMQYKMKKEAQHNKRKGDSEFMKRDSKRNAKNVPESPQEPPKFTAEEKEIIEMSSEKYDLDPVYQSAEIYEFYVQSIYNTGESESIKLSENIPPSSKPRGKKDSKVCSRNAQIRKISKKVNEIITFQKSERKVIEGPIYIKENAELPYVNDEPYSLDILLKRLDNYSKAAGFEICEAPHYPNYIKFICKRGEEYKAKQREHLSLGYILSLTGCPFTITCRKQTDGTLKISKVKNKHNHSVCNRPYKDEKRILTKVKEKLSMMASTLGNFLHPKLIPIAMKYYTFLGYEIGNICAKLSNQFPDIAFTLDQVQNLFKLPKFHKCTVRKSELIEDLCRGLAKNSEKYPNISFKAMKNKRVAGIALVNPSLRSRLSHSIAINTENLPEFTNSWFIFLILAKDEFGKIVPTFLGISLSANSDRIKTLLSMYLEMGFEEPTKVLSDLNKNVTSAVRQVFDLDLELGDPGHQVCLDHVLATTSRRLVGLLGSDITQTVIKKLKLAFSGELDQFYDILNGIYNVLEEGQGKEIIEEIYHEREEILKVYRVLKGWLWQGGDTDDPICGYLGGIESVYEDRNICRAFERSLYIAEKNLYGFMEFLFFQSERYRKCYQRSTKELEDKNLPFSSYIASKLPSPSPSPPKIEKISPNTYLHYIPNQTQNYTSLPHILTLTHLSTTITVQKSSLYLSASQAPLPLNPGSLPRDPLIAQIHSSPNVQSSLIRTLKYSNGTLTCSCPGPAQTGLACTHIIDLLNHFGETVEENTFVIADWLVRERRISERMKLRFFDADDSDSSEDEKEVFRVVCVGRRSGKARRRG